MKSACKSLVALVLTVVSQLALSFPAQDNILTTTGLTNGSATSTAIALYGSAPKNYGIQLVITNATPAAVTMASSTDINASTDTFTHTAHGLTNGVVGQFTTSSALPTGLSTSTNYYVVSAAANTFKVSATLGGAAVDITDAGTGNQTFTPTALSGSAKLQVSNDGTNWTDVANSSQNVTATGNLTFSQTPCPYDYAHLVYTHTSGVVTLSGNVRVKAYREGTVP